MRFLRHVDFWVEKRRQPTIRLGATSHGGVLNLDAQNSINNQRLALIAVIICLPPFGIANTVLSPTPQLLGEWLVATGHVDSPRLIAGVSYTETL